jgi:hypothetical protein
MAMSSIAADALVLVQQAPTPEDPGGRGADFGKSSPLGLLILILFIIAVAFLARSMTKHLKRVPASFEPEEKAAGGPADSADPAGETTEDTGKTGDSERTENAGGKQGLSS